MQLASLLAIKRQMGIIKEVTPEATGASGSEEAAATDVEMREAPEDEKDSSEGEAADGEASGGEGESAGGEQEEEEVEEDEDENAKEGEDE